MFGHFKVGEDARKANSSRISKAVRRPSGLKAQGPCLANAHFGMVWKSSRPAHGRPKAGKFLLAAEHRDLKPWVVSSFLTAHLCRQKAYHGRKVLPESLQS